MKGKSKRLLSTLMAFALVFGLFAAMPLTAYAANLPEISDSLAPAKPTDLVASVNTSTMVVTLTWKDNSNDEAGFVISRREGSGSWNNSFATVGANTTTFTDSTIVAGESYTYRVRSYRLVNFKEHFSNNSNEGTVNVPAVAPNVLTVSNATELENALANMASGAMIKLMADITYNKNIKIETAKTIIFDLNGKTLHATAGVYADNSAKILLSNPNNGQFNVSGVNTYTGDTVDAWNGSSKVEVTNVSSTEIAVYAQSNSEIIVYGNVTHTGESGSGPMTLGSGKITVNGIITVPAGIRYISVGGSVKTEEQYEATSSKPGYREYKGTHNGNTSFVWVKEPSAPATVEPTITGPTSMTLAAGYAATSTGVYTIAGEPAPTVTKTSGDSKITWNNSTKKLDIAPGLTQGSYQVVLKATNGTNTDATLTFTLTVTAATVAPPPGSGSMSNFTKTKTYSPGMFSDVNENAWYGFTQQKTVANAYEYGLMQGTGNTFNPTGNMTLAEAVTIAARVHHIYNGGDGVFTQGSPWYQVYVDYAINNGIINPGTFSEYNKAATRAEMAYIFSRALPETEFAEQNTVYSLPDVTSSTPYREAIFMLYKAGVVAGSDSIGTFSPGNNITRAEASAIISRVILPATRTSGKTF